MCGVKYIILGLALLAISATALKGNETEVCLRGNPNITEIAHRTVQCYNDVFIYKMVKNDTDLICKDFSDYNRTYYNIYQQALLACGNITNATISKQSRIYLNMVKYLMEDDKFVENTKNINTSCFNDAKEELKKCNKQNLRTLGDEDLAKTLIRRSMLKIDTYTCDRLRESKNCTTTIIKTRCGAVMLNYTNTIYDIALEYCTEPTKPNSSPYTSPFTHLSVIVTAFICLIQM